MTTLDDELAAAWDDLAEAAAALALQIRRTAPPDAPSGAVTRELTDTSDVIENLPFDDDDWEAGGSTFKAKPHGSAAVCPAHNVEYRDGRYGSFCPSLSDDPDWSNQKGYCTINPKNAAVYLRKVAAAGKR